MQELRWLLEELRVSFFAQELRTPQPVSVKRLDKLWAQSKSLTRRLGAGTAGCRHACNGDRPDTRAAAQPALPPSIGTGAGQRRRHRSASPPAASVPVPMPAATPRLKLPPPDSRGTIHAPPLQVLAAPTAPFDHLAGHFAVGQPG